MAFHLQQLIKNSIPEFNGENSSKRQNSLTRFLRTADDIYDTLKTNEEKRIFNNLIKTRLSDDTYIIVDNRNIATYPELRNLLNEVYAETKTLEEYEREYTDISQNFNESIRDYGSRIITALNKYKIGYRITYNIKKLDDIFEKHLQRRTIKIFVRGLINAVLKNQIATSHMEELEKIILETERIEKRLMEANPGAIYSSQPEDPNKNSSSSNTNSISKPTCNHCQKPGHTLADCRIRINSEAAKKANDNQVSSNRQQFRPQFNHQNQFQRPTKYCSHCKTTKGHTFDECLSKFRQPAYRNPNFNQSANNRPQYNNYSDQNHAQPRYNDDANNLQQNNYQRRNNYPINNSQNNSQPRNNYPNNNSYPPNNYPQNQRNYSSNYSNPNQPSTSKNFQQHERNPKNTDNQARDKKLIEMMKQLAINYIQPDQTEFDQNNDQGNENGSSQD